MGSVLAGIHAPADLLAMLTEPRAPFDEETDHVVVAWAHGVTPLTRGFQQYPLGAGGLKDLAKWSLWVAEGR
jgi:hypothetical protein